MKKFKEFLSFAIPAILIIGVIIIGIKIEMWRCQELFPNASVLACMMKN